MIEGDEVEFGILVFAMLFFFGATIISFMAWHDNAWHGSVPLCLLTTTVLLIGFSACAAASAVDNVMVSEDVVVKTDGDMRYCNVDGQFIQIHSYDQSNDGFILQKYEPIGLGVTFGEQVRILHNDNVVWEQPNDS